MNVLHRVACCALLVAALTGCESLQRKFTRKPKHPTPPPHPIIHFQDYSRTMTPLDRYRKHYLIFDYWNDDLLQALQAKPLNSKRTRHASTESLAELETMRSLVTDEVAQRMTPLVEQRTAIHRQLQGVAISETQANALWRSLELQSRQIDREFFWRDVEDHLRAQ